MHTNRLPDKFVAVNVRIGWLTVCLVYCYIFCDGDRFIFFSSLDRFRVDVLPTVLNGYMICNGRRVLFSYR